MTVLKRLAFLIILFVFGYSLGAFTAYLKKPLIVSSNRTLPISTIPKARKEKATFQTSILDGLKEKLENLLQTSRGTWGIVIKDLNNGETLSINDDEIYHGASLIKVLTTVTVLTKIETGQESLTRKIKDYTIKDLISSLINRSDNKAWETLNFIAGFNDMQALGKSLGMKNLNVYDNELTPLDIALLLENLYQGEILNDENKKFLFALMQNTETEDRIPAGVPENIQVIHKTGTLDDNIHDAGIILTERPYILVVMGKNTNRKEGTKIIQELSKTVFDHYTKVEPSYNLK